MRTLLKIAAFVLVVITAFFAFFPAGRLRDEIGKALSARIAGTGADIKWVSLESDFIRSVTLNDVVLTPAGGLIEPLHFDSLTLYFPVLFLLRKKTEPVGAYLEGGSVSGTLPRISRLFASLSGSGAGAALPPLVFRRLRLTPDELRRSFVFSGRLEEGHARVQVRSDGFSAAARADRESAVAWRIQSGVKNMDFFSLFFSSPVFGGENFSGKISGVLAGGKVEDIEVSGDVAADSVAFPGVSFYGGEVFELKEVHGRLSVANDVAEFSAVSAEYGRLRLSGGLQIASLSSEALVESSFKVSGSLSSGDLFFGGVDALFEMGGFLSNPVLRGRVSAESFKKGGLELKELTAAASFNERNSGRFRMESFQAKYGAFDISGKGDFSNGGFLAGGLISGLFESPAALLKIEAPWEFSREFKARPEITLSFRDRELRLRGELSYIPSDGRISVSLDSLAGDNILSGKLLRKNGGFVLEEAVLNFSSELLPDAAGVMLFSGGFVKTSPGGFSFASPFSAEFPFVRDSGNFSLSHSSAGAALSVEGRDNALKYGHSVLNNKTIFALEGKSASAGFRADGVYDAGDLKGSFAAGEFRTDFEFSEGSLLLKNMTAGQRISGELTFAENMSGKFFVRDFPLRLKALKIDEKLSARVEIDNGHFEAHLSGENFADKISGEISLSGLSRLNVSIADSGLPHQPAKEPAVRENAVSGDFSLLLSGLKPRKLVMPRARVRAGSGHADFSDCSWDIERRRARGRVQVRNMKKGFVNIFANADFEIDHSSACHIRGEADEVFLNAFYMPFDFDVLISSSGAVFARPDTASNGVEGFWSPSGGVWEVFQAGRRISARWEPQGKWEIKTPGVALQSILKLFNAEMEAFGDVEMSASGSKAGCRLSFNAPDVYVGTNITASGAVSYDGDFIYPDVRIEASGGFIKTEGYIAASPGQVNKILVTADKLRIPVIHTSFGEIRDLSASGKIEAGGAYEMPQIEGEMLSSFSVKHRDYPEIVNFDVRAEASGDKIGLSSDGSVKGSDFKLTGEARLAAGVLKNYSLFLHLPEKGVPVVVPGLLIERRGALRYIMGATPSYGKVSGDLRLADDGEQVSVTGRLKIKDARFSYKQNSWRAKALAAPNVDVTLVFDKNVEWIADKFTADIYGSVNIKAAPYEVNGKISSSRGRLAYLGRNLDVDFAEIDIVKNRIFLTLQAEAAVTRKSPDPPFDAIEDTIRVDIRHSPLDSLDINLASKDYSGKTSAEEAYQMITGVPSAAPGDIEFMRKEIARVIDSSIINPFFSEIVRETGIADDVRLDVSALAERAAVGGKLDGLEAPERMNVYMGKSFGRMYLGYNMEFMRDVSSLQLLSGFEVIYRIRGGNILRAVYQPEENGDSRKYLGIERRIRF